MKLKFVSKERWELEMEKKIKIFGTLAGIIIFLAVLLLIFPPNMWAYYFPSLRGRSSIETAQDFAAALRLNEQDAYELADPKLWPRIDQWMETHHVRDCERIPDEQFTGGVGPNENHSVLFYCFLEEGRYEFEVYDIQIIQLEDTYRVIEWGEVKEGTAR